MEKREIKNRARVVLDPIVAVLAGLGIPPIMISLFGLAVSAYGAIVTARGSLFWGGIILILAGICDVLDGDLARRKDLVSRFGAFIDSTFDRITEFFYFTGILYFYVSRPGDFHAYQLVVIMVALMGSVLTSYTRARAEGLGLACTVGLFERPERLTLLILGLLLGRHVLFGVLVFIAAGSTITSVQRMVHVYRETRSDDSYSV